MHRSTLLIAALALSVGACSSIPSSPAQPAGRGEPGPIRTGAEPLVRRFPGLGHPESVRWQAGTMGDPRVPGPSTYWIDAVVHLDDAALAALPPAGSLSPSGPPEITAALQDDRPDGPWYRGAALDTALAGAGFGVTAHLAPAARVVVLRAVGSGEVTP